MMQGYALLASFRDLFESRSKIEAGSADSEGHDFTEKEKADAAKEAKTVIKADDDHPLMMEAFEINEGLDQFGLKLAKAEKGDEFGDVISSDSFDLIERAKNLVHQAADEAVYTEDRRLNASKTAEELRAAQAKMLGEELETFRPEDTPPPAKAKPYKDADKLLQREGLYPDAKPLKVKQY